MQRRFVSSSVLGYSWILIVVGLSSILGNEKSLTRLATIGSTRETFLVDDPTSKINVVRDRRETIVDRIYDTSNYVKSTKIRPKSLGIGKKIIADSSTIFEKTKKRYYKNRLKNGSYNVSKMSESKKKSRIVHRTKTSRTKSKTVTRRIDERVTRTKLTDVTKERRGKVETNKNVEMEKNKSANEKFVVEKNRQDDRSDGDVGCVKSRVEETSSSLRSLFGVPKLRKSKDCSSRRARVVVTRETIGSAQSSAVPLRSPDIGHRELMNQYEKEQSLDELAGEYVHPEGHVLSTAARDRNRPNKRFGNFVADDTLTSITSKHKRHVGSIVDDRAKRFEVEKNDDNVGQHDTIDRKIVLEGSNVTNDTNIQDASAKEAAKMMGNGTSQISLHLRDLDDEKATDTPWPIVPGPVSCDLDFQLQPSFVAKLGEFDYVVSVQLQRNPDEPADHACTGVVYNPRFIVIAPHCLNDNYGLTVTSTDDLCTIDEMIDVDYVIEHENYDAETRSNDIALIKLKSEIHKRSAKFPKDDGTLGKNFYAVGFGELMWRSFPKKIGKLLQKVPVRRYPSLLKESPGTMHITTSHMDLTGAFRGDFGGALINPRGEFVGLKSKLIKKTTDYEVYTRVRTYMPWIRSMVALHGSW